MKKHYKANGFPAYRFLSALIIVLTSLGCAVIGIGPVLITTEQEVMLGAEAAKDVEAKNKLIKGDVADYINEVGQKVALVCGRNDLKYNYKAIDSDTINAFALPGGFIYVYKGLLSKLENEAQLAAVLGHETAHVAARHGAKRLQDAFGIAVLTQVVFSGKEPSEKLKRDILQFILNLSLQGYGKENEFEADKLGTVYIYKSGYNPKGMEEVLTILKNVEGRDPSKLEAFLASHPPTSQRLERVRKQLKNMPEEALSRATNKEKYKKKLSAVSHQ